MTFTCPHCAMHFDAEPFAILGESKCPRRPPFEDLLRDGVIRLRVNVVDAEPRRIILEAYQRICRGWRFMEFDAEADFERRKWLVTLTFAPKPPDVRYQMPSALPDVGYVTHTVTAEERYGTADFDAMLRALEPYELVEPRCPGSCVTCDLLESPSLEIPSPAVLPTPSEAQRRLFAEIREGSFTVVAVANEPETSGYCTSCGGEHGEHRRGCPVKGE